MDLFTFCTLILGVLSLVYLFIQRKHQYWKLRGVLHIEPEFYYGNSRGIAKKFHQSVIINKIYTELKTAGPIFGIYFYTRAVAIATDLDLIKSILIKDFNNFPNRGSYSNERDDPISANLVNIEDDAWRNLRHKLTPTFTSGKIKFMFSTVTEVADKLIERIELETSGTGQIEVKNILARFTTDVIGSTAFGIECNSLEDPTNQFYEIGQRAFSPGNFLKRSFLQTYRELGRKLRMRLSAKAVEEFYVDVVKKTIQYREENQNEKRKDFMNLLMELRDPSKPDPLTFNQILAQSVVFFLAGFETSSTTLTYCMFELSLDQKLQEKARESVKRVLEKHNNQITYESVNDMQYLEQCVNEALRKYPPAWATARVAKKDYEVPNTKIVIEKNMAVMIPIFSIHHDPQIYPEPETYDPDRFAPEELAKRHPMSFLPFGEGPRICIGMRFAIVEVKIALAKILMNFEFSLDRSKTSFPMKIAANRLQILSPAEGVFVNFKKL